MARLPAILLAASIAAGAAPGPAGEATFNVKPTATKAGDKVRIAFTVSAATDAEVAVLDAAGKAVRHLGGGMLGENPPEPFRKGLAQEIEWDGRDDFGKPAAGGPFSVRVGLGLKAEFDRILGWSGQEVENVRGLCCGPDGTLYLVYGGSLWGHRQSTLIAAFDREGRYLREVLPGPGGMPAEKRKGWPQLKLDGGGEVPLVWHPLTRALSPSAIFGDRNFPTATADGRLVLVSGADSGMAGVTEPDYHEGRRLLVVGADGGVPENHLGPVLAGEKEKGFGCVAASPDGKFAYVSGVGSGGQVWRAELSGQARAEVLVKDGPKEGCGISVDKAGNIYVSEAAGDRIAVYKPDGAALKSLPVKSPHQVLVSRRTGAIYAVADAGKRVVKLGGLDDPAEKAAYEVRNKPNAKEKLTTLLALDDSADPHVLWVVTRNWINSGIRRLVDAGGKLEDKGDPVSGKSEAMNFSGSAAVVAGRLFTRGPDLRINYSAKPLVFSAETGALERVLATKIPGPGNSIEFTAGKDGLLYTQTNGWPAEGLLCRLSPAGELMPFASGQAIATYHGHTRTGGIFVNRFGDIYVPGGDKYRALNPFAVRVYGPDGKQKGDPAVNVAGAYFGGIAVDSRGNVYLGTQVVEKDHVLPEWTDGRLPKPSAHGYPANAYRQVGAVVKFKPAGGAVVLDPNGAHIGAAAYKRSAVSLKNAEWLRRAGEVPARAGGADGVHCFCETSRFDIDFHDRLFVADTFRFGVQVLDAAGNPVALIGSYGNMDNRGPKSAHPEPAIPLGWPLAAQVDGDQVYVLDLENRRVVVARLGCAVTETCAVK